MLNVVCYRYKLIRNISVVKIDEDSVAYFNLNFDTDILKMYDSDNDTSSDSHDHLAYAY